MTSIVKVLLESKTSPGEYFRAVLEGQIIWTRYELLARHYDTVLNASLASIMVGIHLHTTPVMVDFSKLPKTDNMYANENSR